MGRPARHRVVALVGEQSSTFDLSVAAEVFGRDPNIGVPWYRFTVATEFPGRVTFDLGLNLMVDHDLSAFREPTPSSWLGRRRPLQVLYALCVTHIDVASGWWRFVLGPWCSPTPGSSMDDERPLIGTSPTGFVGSSPRSTS